ncbi:MAG: peptide chain release factor N(5)-glutamine methyltransferase [Geminicoccaceae bacterium]
MTIRDAIEQAAKCLKIAGIDGARHDAWLLLCHVLQQDRATLLAHALDSLGPEAQHSFSRLVDRRADREPIAQIIGRKEFWSLEFRITADVLCPRPDSECLIEAALGEVDRRYEARTWPGRILDLGTGSGCLLLTLLSEWPAASGVGVDISLRALSMARLNGERLALTERAHWLCSDWGAALEGGFDLIVSNPPYVTTGEAETLAPEVRDFEPATALFAGVDGLDAYRLLAGDLHRLLAPDGVTLLEVGAGQAQSVERLMEDNDLRPIGRRQDLAGIDRCLIVERG